MARVVSFEERDPEEATFSDRVEYVRRYLARVDAIAGAPRALYAYNPLFQRGAPHPDDPVARVKEFKPVQIPGRDPHGNYRFEIEIRWDSSIERKQNPLDKPADIEWSNAGITRVVTIDANGNPITNTAGSLVTDLTEEMGILVCDVTKNVPSVPTWFATYPNAVNSDAFTIDGFKATPRTMKLQRFKLGATQRDEDFNVTYRQLSYQLYYTADTWDRRVLNRGLYEVEVRRVAQRQVKDLVRITNENGEPVEEPAFLDADGRRPRRKIRDPQTGRIIGEELKPPPLDPADIVTLRIQTKKKLPFRVLPRA